MFRPLETRLISTGLVTMLIVGFVTYFSGRLYATYRVATDMAVLQGRLDTFVKEQDATHLAIAQRLNEIERTLYTIPVATTGQAPAPRRPLALEQWELNQFKDLREAIKQLQSWRYRTEK
jgi:hypothetical protein